MDHSFQRVRRAQPSQKSPKPVRIEIVEQSPFSIDALLIAEAVNKGISRVHGAKVPVGDKASLLTVGPGRRIGGVAVHRVAGALDIDIVLVATVKKQASLPVLAARVRRMVREAVQTLTSERVGRVNIRITVLHFED